MIGMLNTEQRIRREVDEMMEQLRRFGSGEISDSLNIAMGGRLEEKAMPEAKAEPEVVYKDRLYLAKRRGDPLLIHIIADANCAYCRRLVSLKWMSCPYCGNGKHLPAKKF